MIEATGRTLLRSLAAEGRTVLLSSHLMSEMAMTADRLIIIGRDRGVGVPAGHGVLSSITASPDGIRAWLTTITRP